MVEKLGGVVKREEVIILFGLDNGTFYEEDEEDGTRRVPRRDEKGLYHVVGCQGGHRGHVPGDRDEEF
jgi:hypothetical protein